MQQKIITLEELKAFNPSYHPHDCAWKEEVNEQDLEIVNHESALMFANQVNEWDERHPATGDLVIFKEYGKIYPRGFFKKDMYFDAGHAVCLSASPNLQGGVCDASGGPWPCVQYDKFEDCGMYAERTFWTFGRFGWCAHGGVYYRLPVKVWLHKSVGELNKDY
jgi:hypothetical protein